MINDTILNEVKETNFLGVILTYNLSWKKQINEIVNKLNKYCSILYLTRNFLTISSLKLIYHSIIYSQLNYCNIIWGKAPQTYINKLFVAQKRIIRTIKNRPRTYHTNNDFKDLGILKLNEINKYFSCIFAYKSINQLTHPFNYFTFPDRQTHNLRYSTNLRTPLMRTTQSQTSPSFYICNHWNSLPVDIRSKPSVVSFRSSLKRHLLAQY